MPVQRHWYLALAVFTALMLTACGNGPPPVSNPVSYEDLVFVDNTHDIVSVDPDKGEVFHIQNKRYISHLKFDKNRQQLVATSYSPEHKFDGIVYFDVQGKSRNEVNFWKRFDKPFAPGNWYLFQDIYLMTSMMALRDDGGGVTELGFFDSKELNMISRFLVPGSVEDIIGNGSKAYISSNSRMGKTKRSNIYEVDLRTREVRPIFAESPDHVPLQLAYHDGVLYGLYQDYDTLPKDFVRNLLVKIDLKTGKVVQTLPLSEKSWDLIVSSDGKYAFVTHCSQQQQEKLSHPLTRVDLTTFQATDVPGDYRPVSILEHKGRFYIGDTFTNSLIVINGQSLQIEKKIPLSVAPHELADENGSSKDRGRTGS